MPLSDADAYQYLESDKAGAVRLLQIGASWAGKNTCIVNPKEHLSHTVDLELRYCQKLRCGHWCLIRYSHTRMFGVSTGSV